MQLRYQLFLIILFAIIKSASAQNYLLPNEQLIISFKTVNEKRIVLAKDTSNKYMAYRFGTEGKIEFNFPQFSNDSWQKFTYSYYFRGGGAENEGLDLNYVYFINGKNKYVIYQNYSAVEDNTNCGVKIIDINTNQIIELIGIPESRVGNLIDLRDNELIQIGQEQFD